MIHIGNESITFTADGAKHELTLKSLIEAGNPTTLLLWGVFYMLQEMHLKVAESAQAQCQIRDMSIGAMARSGPAMDPAMHDILGQLSGVLQQVSGGQPKEK